MKIVNLKDFPSILNISGNSCLTGTGNVVYCYKITLPEIFTLSEGDFDKIHDSWFSAFKDFTEGVIIQKMDIYLNKFFDVSSMPDETYLQKATVDHFKERTKREHHSYLFFTKAKSSILSDKIINPFKAPPKIKDFERELISDKNFKTEVDRAVDFINNSRFIKLEEAEPQEIKYIEHAHHNAYYEDRFTDAELDDLTIGEKHIGIAAITSVQQLGETISNSVVDGKMSIGDAIYHTGYMDELGLKLDFDHIINQVIFIKDHIKEKSQIRKQKGIFEGSASFNSEYKQDEEQLDSYLKEISLDEKIRLSGMHFNVIHFARTKEEYEHNENQIITEFKKVNITPYIPARKNKANLYYNTFFSNIINLDKKNVLQPIDLQQSLCFFTNVSNYRDDENGVYFNDRVSNNPVKKDIWDEDKLRLKARNFGIIAATGEGKSVLSNHIFRQYHEQGVKIVICDLGESYRNLAQLYPDDTVYIRYEEGKGLGLNPFMLEQSGEVSQRKISELSAFVFKLWKRDRLPDDSERVSLEKIIALYYQTIKKGHSFPSFYSFLEDHREDVLNHLDIDSKFYNITDFLHMTSIFVKDGLLSFLFKDDEDKSYQLEDKSFIVFEMDEIKDNKLLLSIMLHMISEAIQKVVWSDKDTRGVVFFDEFAKMLKFPEVLSSAEYFFQAGRKQNASTGIVLQSPDQLPKNDSAEAIIDNMQVLYVLESTKGYDKVIERFKLKEHDRIQLNSIKSSFEGKQKYSEFLLSLGGECNVFRLELPAEALYAYQTEGAEFNTIKELYQDEGSMERAIEKYKETKN